MARAARLHLWVSIKLLLACCAEVRRCSLDTLFSASQASLCSFLTPLEHYLRGETVKICAHFPACSCSKQLSSADFLCAQILYQQTPDLLDCSFLLEKTCRNNWSITFFQVIKMWRFMAEFSLFCSETILGVENHPKISVSTLYLSYSSNSFLTNACFSSQISIVLMHLWSIKYPECVISSQLLIKPEMAYSKKKKTLLSY